MCLVDQVLTPNCAEFRRSLGSLFLGEEESTEDPEDVSLHNIYTF